LNATIQYKRAKKNNPEPVSQERRAFLKQTLDTILEKMKWDEDDDPGDMDDDDLAAFDLLRKVRHFLPTSLSVLTLTCHFYLQDLRVFLDSIQTLDNELVTSTIHSVAITTLTAFEGGVNLKWQDAEMAIHLVYLYGESIKGSYLFAHLDLVILTTRIARPERSGCVLRSTGPHPEGEAENNRLL